MALASTLKNRLILTTALVGVFVGYGRRAYAACVTTGVPPNYLCSGVTAATQTITADGATVLTDGTFSINTGAGAAISITGDGALGFTDTYTSIINGFSNGLFINATGDDGITPGSVTINVDSTITGATQSGIYALNSGTGAITITADGDVTSNNNSILALSLNAASTDIIITTGVGSNITSTSSNGILSDNRGAGILTIVADGDVAGYNLGIGAWNAGTDLSITTGVGTTITGTNNAGIEAQSYGAGLLTITADGDVTGGNRGIYARNYGTDLTVTTGVGTMITGTSQYGIDARNYGTGALSITTDGDVSGGDRGIYARNNGTGADLSVMVGMSTSIVGGSDGIRVRNYGTGATTITADGDVTGTGRFGIDARNSVTGTDVSVVTGVGTVMAGYNDGIVAINYGAGALTITADGDAIATYNNGIYALNSGTDLTLTAGAGTTMSAQLNGIYARNNGTGALTITANGDMTGTVRYGIQANNFGTDLSVTSGVGTSLSGGNNGIFARNYGTGALSITADGDVTGGYRGIYARNDGTGLSVTTGVGSSITGSSNTGIYARNDGTGALSITADGDVSSSVAGIFARNYGTDLSVTTGAGTTITGTNNFGLAAVNSGTGLISITADGNVAGLNYGIVAANTATGTDITITTGAGTTIAGTTYFGIYALNYGTGVLTITNSGDVIGNTGIFVKYNGALSGGITNNAGATIEGTGGTAINLTSLTASLPITINGGHIIGDVVDDTVANGFSLVTIAGDFTSEGNFNVSDFNVDTGVEFTFGAGKTISSFGDVDVDGTMTVSAAGSVITGDLNINNGGILTSGHDFSISGQLTNNGTIDIATNRTLTVDTMAAGTGALSFGVTSLADHAQLTLTSGAANLTGQTITIDVAGVNAITANDEILLIDGLGALIGGPGAVAASVTDNSVLWNFEIIDGTGIGAPTDNSDLFLRAAMAASLTDLSDTPNNENAAGVLIDLEGATANPELLDVLANLNGAPDQQTFNEVLEAVQPAMDGGAIGAVLDVTANALDLTGSRLEDLNGGYNIGGYESGFTEGTTTQPTSLVWAANFGDEGRSGFGNDNWGPKEWEQIFGQTSKQDRRDGIEGYRAHTVGGAFGADTGNVFNNGTIGIAFSYATTQVDSKNANSAKTDIDSYQATLYGDHKLGEDGYLSGMAAYVWNSNDTARFNVGGTPGLTARGNFDSSQMALRAEVGHHINFGSYTITPNARLNYTHYTADDYTETGTGGANLNVKTQSLDSLEAGLGAKVSTMFKIKNSESAVIPSVQVGYRYGVISDPIEMSSSFTGGGASFQTEGAEPAKHRFNFGTTAKYIVNEQWDLTASYTFDYKEDYTAHAGFLRASYKF